MIVGAMMLNGTRRIAAKSGTQLSTMIRPRQIAEVHAGDEPPHEFLLLDEEQRSRLEAPDQQAAQQHGGGRRAGNAERDHRQERAGTGGMRGGLRRNDAFELSRAEPCRRVFPNRFAMP